MDIRELLRRITEFLRSLFQWHPHVQDPQQGRGISTALIQLHPIQGLVREINEEERPVKVHLELEVKNVSEAITAAEISAGGVTAKINTATTLLSYMGGWVRSFTQHDVSDFYGIPSTLAPNSTFMGHRNFEPPANGGDPAAVAATHAVYALSAHQLTTPGGFSRPRQDLLVSAPISITAETNWFDRPPNVAIAPPDLPGPQISPPVYIGLMGPLEVFDVSNVDSAGKVTTQLFLMVVGQIVNPYGRSTTVSSLKLHLQLPGDHRLVRDFVIRVGGGLPASGQLVMSPNAADVVVGTFYFAEPLPSWASPLPNSARVFIEASCTVDGRAIPNVTRGAPVHMVTTAPISAPVLTPPDRPSSVYMWNQGPAASSLTGHGSDPHTRYVYDLGFLDGNTETKLDANGNPLDRLHHTNFLIWKQPLYAVADGTVVFVRKDQDDIDAGGSFTFLGGNLLIIRHDRIGPDKVPYFSLYAHMARDTCPFALDSTGHVVHGQHVREGDHVGDIGSSGNTGGGPHLHFSFYTLKDGRPLMVAPRFKNVAAAKTGTIVPGVLRSGTFAQAKQI